MRITHGSWGLLAAAAALGTLTACGSGGARSNDAVASVAGATASSSATPGGGNASGSPIQYAQCMRANGVPDFPDPDTANGGMQIRLPADADSAAVKAAGDKCKQYLPNGGAMPPPDPGFTEQMRKYAQCMRDHGIANFPDPDPNNGGSVILNSSGLNPDDPAFKAADQACTAMRPSAGPAHMNPAGGQ